MGFILVAGFHGAGITSSARRAGRGAEWVVGRYGGGGGGRALTQLRRGFRHKARECGLFFQTPIEYQLSV
jgi:hypothetical protein